MGDLIHVRHRRFHKFLPNRPLQKFLPIHPLPPPALQMNQDYASITVSGEVFARDHAERSCLIIVWQDVCNMHSQSFYIRALFGDQVDSIPPAFILPDLHSPLSFTGTLTAFEHSEAVVRIEDHSHFRANQILTL